MNHEEQKKEPEDTWGPYYIYSTGLHLTQFGWNDLSFTKFYWNRFIIIIVSKVCLI